MNSNNNDDNQPPASILRVAREFPKWVFAFAAIALVAIVAHALFVAECRTYLFGMSFGKDIDCEESNPIPIFASPKQYLRTGRLISTDEGICVLSRLTGDLRGAEGARVAIDDDGYWVLEKLGKQHVATAATCLEYK